MAENKLADMSTELGIITFVTATLYSWVTAVAGAVFSLVSWY